MKTFKLNIAKTISDAVASSFAGATLAESEVLDLLEYPTDTSMGDIALPCFKLSKILRRSPIQIAAALAEAFSAEGAIKAEAVNGYLNFRIDSSALANEVLCEVFAKGEKYGSPDNGAGDRKSTRLNSSH